MRVGSERHAHGSPAALRVWQPPGVVVVLVLVVVVCMPPPGIGAVLVVLCDVVVDGGAPGVAGIVIVVLLVVDEDDGGVVCANPSGVAMRHAAAVTIKKRFISCPPVPTPVAGRATLGAKQWFPRPTLRFSKLGARGGFLGLVGRRFGLRGLAA